MRPPAKPVASQPRTHYTPTCIRAVPTVGAQPYRRLIDSIYLHDPNRLKIEFACYKLETPVGFRDIDVLIVASRLRVDRGDHHITEEHLSDAIETLMETRTRLEPS